MRSDHRLQLPTQMPRASQASVPEQEEPLETGPSCESGVCQQARNWRGLEIDHACIIRG